MTDSNPWSWAATVQTIIGGGIGTAAVQGVLPFIRARGQRKEHGAYMAKRLAVMLEAYAEACADLISDNSELESSPGEQYPAWNTKVPASPVYPDDSEGWRALDRELAGDCLNFPNKVRGSQSIIDFEWDHIPDNLDNTITEQVATRGLEAWRLAQALRRRHGVKAADLIYDYAETLKTSLEEAKTKVQRRAQENAAAFADIGARLPPDFPASAMTKGILPTTTAPETSGS